jgi:RNA polymerase sigma-70 factor, ECF subfamily
MTDSTVNFELIYKTYYPALCRAANHIINDADASHDLVQEVFIKLYGRRDTLSEITNLRAYLYRAVINSSVTYISGRKRQTDIGLINIAETAGSDTSLISKQLADKINHALDQLPPKCRAVFVLSRMEEMKNKEIAEHLGLSLKTVENQMGIALKKLKEWLGPRDLLLLVFCHFLGCQAAAFLF